MKEKVLFMSCWGISGRTSGFFNKYYDLKEDEKVSLNLIFSLSSKFKKVNFDICGDVCTIVNWEVMDKF